MARLPEIKIASPCPASWDQMLGDDRERFCKQCNRKVFNLSEMTRPQVQNFLEKSTGRQCVRMFYREDGTLLTADCPVGAAAWRRQLTWILSLSASFFLAIVGLALFGTFQMNRTGGLRTLLNPAPVAVMGGMAPPPPRMVLGEMCPPEK